MKYVVIFLILLATVSVSFAEPQDMVSEEPIMIKLHQTISFGALTVSFSEIDDSRCPVDVTCVWEGRASVTFNVYDKIQNQTLTLTTNEIQSQNVGSYKITLIDVLPYPVSTTNISKDYVATIIISKNKNDLIMSPLKQFKNGTPGKLIECNPGLSLIIKNYHGSPACVKPETKIKLIERNWTTNAF
ncbi:hypothetical protein [Candidatus Nitrosarchaeum limnium]|jgi:hypothetical protein|uniref:Uncharacterized protein n=1 Tax=Candidatus Nitrosarchaeum limnium BG20 TaxID=859192 RepID=S2E4L4_9ARCH|nr:hypothetical protein [Candidatus Nitrosarchaeum limnium]EPA06140.1 hypothetical protein BG20_I0644 [Candidatus Nitrosarchaeum limnium BG20]